MNNCAQSVGFPSFPIGLAQLCALQPQRLVHVQTCIALACHTPPLFWWKDYSGIICSCNSYLNNKLCIELQWRSSVAISRTFCRYRYKLVIATPSKLATIINRFSRGFSRARPKNAKRRLEVLWQHIHWQRSQFILWFDGMSNEGGFILLLDLPDLEMLRALRWINKLICHMRDSLFYPSVTRRIIITPTPNQWL